MVTFVELSNRQLGGVVMYRHWPAPSAWSSQVKLMLSSACLHWLSCFDEDSFNKAPPQQGTSAILVLLCNYATSAVALCMRGVWVQHCLLAERDLT